MEAVALIGCALGVVVASGVCVNTPAMLVLWALYLSVYSCGQAREAKPI